MRSFPSFVHSTNKNILFLPATHIKEQLDLLAKFLWPNMPTSLLKRQATFFSQAQCQTMRAPSAVVVVMDVCARPSIRSRRGSTKTMVSIHFDQRSFSCTDVETHSFCYSLPLRRFFSCQSLQHTLVLVVLGVGFGSVSFLFV